MTHTKGVVDVTFSPGWTPLCHEDFKGLRVEKLLEESIVVGIMETQEGGLVKSHVALWMNSDNRQT